MIWIALLPTRMPRRMKIVAGFQWEGRVRKRERDLVGDAAVNVVGDASATSLERRRGLGISEVQKDVLAMRGTLESEA